MAGGAAAGTELECGAARNGQEKAAQHSPRARDQDAHGGRGGGPGAAGGGQRLPEALHRDVLHCVRAKNPRDDDGAVPPGSQQRRPAEASRSRPNRQGGGCHLAVRTIVKEGFEMFA